MVTEGWLEPIPAVIGGEVGYNIYAVIQNVGTKFNYEFFSFLWVFFNFLFFLLQYITILSGQTPIFSSVLVPDHY